MIQQFPVHGRAAAGAQQRILTEGGQEQLSEGGPRQHAVTPGIEGPGGGKERGQQFPHLLVARVTVQAKVANALKALGQDVLHHPADETQDR